MRLPADAEDLCMGNRCQTVVLWIVITLVLVGGGGEEEAFCFSLVFFENENLCLREDAALFP